MNVPDVFVRIKLALESAGINYMLSGSFASALYGVPRSTQDIDLVIAASPEQLQKFVQALPAEQYYVDLESALEAHERQSLFNVIDQHSGWKIDLIIRKSRAFSQEEFGRRQLMNVQGVPLFVVSPEDIIVAKLEWSNLAASQRQIEDVASVVRARQNLLDYAYIKKWVNELGLEAAWRSAQSMAGITNAM